LTNQIGKSGITLPYREIASRRSHRMTRLAIRLDLAV
jgi:hypothetical protein